MPRLLSVISSIIFSAAIASSALAENWPFFRGPTRQGVSVEKNLPTEWNKEKNIAWKAAIPGESWSSPIVWGDHVFVTTTTDNGMKCHALCLNRKTGDILWSKELFEQIPIRKEGKNSYATPTPATDGERVYAVFGDGSVAALNYKGEVEWQNREAKFYSQHGLGASPVLYKGLLIMPFDGSSTGENKRIGWQLPWDKSYINAYDVKTGKVKWRATRGQSRIAHVTPNIMEVQGREILVSAAGDVVQGFDPANGERLWSVSSQGEGVVPSMVVGGGKVFTVSGYEKPTIRAVKPAKDSAEIVWEQRKGVPMLPSFVYKKPYLFGITEGGVAICLQEETGDIVWQERVGGNHSSSPVLAEDRIYFLSEEGEATVIEAAPEFKILARSPLNEKCQASMAFSQGNIFLRTEKNLYCIGERR